MAAIEGLRESLAGFAKRPDFFQPYYVERDGCKVSYNGSFYTIFLPCAAEPPTFADHVAMLMCKSDTVSVWRLEYPFDKHCERVNKKKGSVVAKPAETMTVAQRITLMDERRAPPWELLGVPRLACRDEISRSYRALALLVHPDKCTDPHALKAFQAVTRAHAAMVGG